MCRVGVGGNPAIMNLLLQSVDVRMNSLNGNTGGAAVRPGEKVRVSETVKQVNTRRGAALSRKMWKERSKEGSKGTDCTLAEVVCISAASALGALLTCGLQQKKNIYPHYISAICAHGDEKELNI